ncbi:hypothetical protein [Acidocella sp.]|jgi:xanthine dehydrogenase accessory factor|uniref:hypothetical protein n=1 Tax=Acidocella sp. TaxID=50710 RepID=UPI002F41E751
MNEGEKKLVLIRGSGDVGSAVAVVLHRAGYIVALHDDPAPTAPRRGMAFTDAVFDGSASLEGLTAQLVETASELRHAMAAHGTLPVTVWSFSDMLSIADWSVIIDARMRKRAVPETLAAIRAEQRPASTAARTAKS